MKTFETFFVQFGYLMHYSHAYWKYTAGGTKNLNHENTAVLLAAASNAETQLHTMFGDMSRDYCADKLGNKEYGKFLRYYELIVNDSVVIAKKIKTCKEILNAIKN